MTGALIVAEAGHRRSGAEDMDLFVPMTHLAGTTVIKCQIRSLKKAGIARIAVMTRPENQILERHLAHLAVRPCFCETEPVEKGLKELEDCDTVLLIPGDLPLFQAETVVKLLEASGDVRMPLWNGQRGEMVVLGEAGLKRIREEGEAGFFRIKEGPVTEVPVEDEGVVLRIRETEDVKRLETYVREKRESDELGFQMKVVLGRNEAFFGPGAAEFLMKIKETGSILAACQEMNMSYSKGWKLLNHIEEEIGFPFLVRKNGGRGGGFSVLTPEGENFVRKYYAFSQDVRRMAEHFFDQYFGGY